jgi:hypothetical protein
MGSDNFGKSDPDWHQIEKPDPHQSQKPGLVQDPHQRKIQELCRLKIGTWRAVDAHKGVIKAQNGAGERLYNVFFIGVANSHHFDGERDPNPHQS